MAAKTAHVPVTDTDLAAAYLDLARLKFSTDRAQRTADKIDDHLAALLLSDTALQNVLDDPAAPRRLTVTRRPASTTRRSKRDARTRVLAARPDLADRVITVVHPSRPTRATIVSATFTDVADQYTGDLAPVDVNRRNIWPMVTLREQAREYINDAAAQSDALRDQIDAALRADGLVDQYGGRFVHTLPNGGQYRIGTSSVTERLNTAALRELDPDLWEQVSDVKPVPERFGIAVSTITPGG